MEKICSEQGCNLPATQKIQKNAFIQRFCDIHYLKTQPFIPKNGEQTEYINELKKLIQETRCKIVSESRFLIEAIKIKTENDFKVLKSFEKSVKVLIMNEQKSDIHKNFMVVLKESPYYLNHFKDLETKLISLEKNAEKKEVKETTGNSELNFTENECPKIRGKDIKTRVPRYSIRTKNGIKQVPEFICAQIEAGRIAGLDTVKIHNDVGVVTNIVDLKLWRSFRVDTYGSQETYYYAIIPPKTWS